MQTTSQTPDAQTDERAPLLVLDTRGRLFEVSPEVLEGFEVDASRIASIAAQLPRRPDGSLQLPSWIDPAGLEAEVEAQGQAANLAAAVLLGLAGCAGPSGALEVSRADDSCVAVETVDDELGLASETDACEETFQVALPSGGHDVRIADDHGVLYEGRVYVGHELSDPVRLDVGRRAPIAPIEAPAPGDENPVAELATVTGVAYDHGGRTSGQVSVRDTKGELLAEGRMGAPLEIPVGAAMVTLVPDGFADDVSHTQRVLARSGDTLEVQAQIASGVLEVRVREAGEPVFATVHLIRNGQQVGTVGSHVPWKVSAGSYDLHVLHGGEERTVEDVHLEPSQRRAIRVDF